MGATGHDVHIDRLLSEMAIDYRPEGFIADTIFPMVTVQKQSDLYRVFDRADYTTRKDTRRAPGTPARQITRSTGSDTYYANNYALAYPVTLEDRTNADPELVTKLYDGGAQFCLDHLLLDYEMRVATMVTSTSNVGSSSAVSSAWDGAGSPLADVNQAIDNLEDTTGVRATDVTFGLDAWRSFRRDSTVRNLIFGTNNGGGYPRTEDVAKLLDVKRVQVGGSYINQSAAGQSESLTQIWGDKVLIQHRPDSPTIERPSFGYSFRWAAPGLPNMQVERHPYDSRAKSELVEVGYYQDEKITSSSHAFLLTAVNSST